MKNYYIRTKHNIFEVVDETDLVYRIVGASRDRNNIYSRTKKLNDVINQANTIEELCDEFVWVSVNGEYHNRKANAYGLETSKMHRNSPQIKEIYGAIWTDKGLIYVAKMNDEGELELL